jgi:MFS family permease
MSTHESDDPVRSRTDHVPDATEPATSMWSPRLVRAAAALGAGGVFVAVVCSNWLGSTGLVFVPLVAAWAANVYLGAALNDPLTQLVARYRRFREDGYIEDRARPSTSPLDEPGTGSPTEPRPMVRSFSEALPTARRLIDAALLLGVSILAFVCAGSGGTDQPMLMVLIGIGAVVYAGYVALSGRGYVMPYWIYGLAVVGLIVLFFGKTAF